MKQLNEGLVSFIVINYNGGNVVGDCIQSIFNQYYNKIEVIVVDNNSSDTSLQELTKNFHKIKIISLKENKGYAGGINEGLKVATGEYIVVMNNDLILDKKIIEEILKRKEEGDIFGVKNYYYSHPKVLWSAGTSLNRIIMKGRLVGNREKDLGQYDHQPFKQIVGSFMLIKRKVFDKIGGFDEEFFCYYEETEFQERAARNGFKILFVPRATLLHHVAHSSGGGANKITDYYLVRNRGKFIRDYQNSYFKPISYVSLFAEAVLRSLRHDFKLRFKDSLYPLIGFRDFVMGKGGPLK